MTKGYSGLLAWLLVLALPLATTPGCGVISGFGGPQPVIIKTEDGGVVYADGEKTEHTGPEATVLLHPKAKHFVEVIMPDGAKGQAHVGKTLRTFVVICDAAFTLGIGLLIDYLSGALYQLDTPIRINVGKAPERPPPTTTTGTTGTTGTTTNVLDPDAEPCSVCGEPRGNVTPCPHCGMD